MAATVRIVDEVTGRGRRAPVELHLLSERLSAHELIEQRVRSEVASFNGAEVLFLKLVPLVGG